MDEDEFTEGFAPRAACAGYEVRREDGAWVVADRGGELRHYVRTHGARYVLSSAERAGAERSVMSARSLVDIERYLTFVLGNDYRASRQLPLIVFSGDEDAAGYRVVLQRDEMHLIGADGYPQIVWLQPESSVPRWELREFTYYADASLSEMWQSLADPSGAPLFAGCIQANGLRSDR